MSWIFVKTKHIISAIYEHIKIVAPKLTLVFASKIERSRKTDST